MGEDSQTVSLAPRFSRLVGPEPERQSIPEEAKPFSLLQTDAILFRWLLDGGFVACSLYLCAGRANNDLTYIRDGVNRTLSSRRAPYLCFLVTVCRMSDN